MSHAMCASSAPGALSHALQGLPKACFVDTKIKPSRHRAKTRYNSISTSSSSPQMLSTCDLLVCERGLPWSAAPAALCRADAVAGRCPASIVWVSWRHSRDGNVLVLVSDDRRRCKKGCRRYCQASGKTSLFFEEQNENEGPTALCRPCHTRRAA